MSCILTISGKDLNIDSLLDETQLLPYNKGYKGQPKLTTRPDGKKWTSSFVSIEASNADFNAFSQQVADAITFLQENRNKLVLLTNIYGIDNAILDFGIDL